VVIGSFALRHWCLAAALGSMLAAGCGPQAPPSLPTSAPAAGSPSGRVRSEDTTAADAPTPPAAFDVGEIKTAAEYLREPEFAEANTKRGELLSLACAACHSFGAGEKTIVGPNLHGVFGRPAGAVEGFDYSPGLKSSGLVWTPRALEAWLADPASFVADTKMTFSGYRSAEDRRDLIAYLLKATQ
jgi:cytochrome c